MKRNLTIILLAILWMAFSVYNSLGFTATINATNSCCWYLHIHSGNGFSFSGSGGWGTYAPSCSSSGWNNIDLLGFLGDGSADGFYIDQISSSSVANATASGNAHIGVGSGLNSSNYLFHANGDCSLVETNPPPPVYWCCADAINVDPALRRFAFWVSKPTWHIAEVTGLVELGGSIHRCITNDTPINCYIAQYVDPFDTNSPPASTNSVNQTGTNSTAGPSTGSSSGDSSAGGGANAGPAHYGGGTNNITGNTDVGDSAIYDAITKFAKQNHRDLEGVSNAVKSMSITNNISFTNMSETGVSNLIGAAHATNQTHYANTPSSTNWSTAETAAMSALGSTPGQIDTLVSSIGSAPDVGSGSPDLEIVFAGQTLNLDPAVRFPGAQTLVYNGFTLSMLIWFAWFASRLYSATVAQYASTQTGGVPNLESTVVGTGGNIAGTILAVVVPLVIVGGWIVIWQYIFDRISTNLGLVNGLNPFTGMNSTALYLLTSFFPVNLILTLLWTAISLQLGVTKVVLIATSVQKFLFGK